MLRRGLRRRRHHRRSRRARARRSVLTSPIARPPTAVRALAGLAGVGALFTTAALLLSDRAPGILRSLFGDRARRLWGRIDAGNRVDLPAGADVATQPDFVVHVVLWAVVAALAGLTIWTWRGLLAATALLGAVGIGLELAQGRFATTRSVEASDALANTIGIGVGATLAGLCYLVWSAAEALLRTARPDRT